MSGTKRVYIEYEEDERMEFTDATEIRDGYTVVEVPTDLIDAYKAAQAEHSRLRGAIEELYLEARRKQDSVIREEGRAARRGGKHLSDVPYESLYDKRLWRQGWEMQDDEIEGGKRRKLERSIDSIFQMREECTKIRQGSSEAPTK